MMKVRVLIALSILWSLAGCAVSSGERIHSLASKNDYASSVEYSGGFSQVVFSNQMPLAANGALNIYLEGDGVPWQFKYFISPDPTPRNPLMLDLMSLDRNASFYVGRPCYNGLHKSLLCEPKYWTSSRHAKVIVDSMAGTIAKLRKQSGATRINLFGFSGGGAMAMLIAAQLPNTQSLVTIAGNLDLRAWTLLHGYSPLYGSLDPATEPLLPVSIRQIHLMGEKDNNIPPAIVLKQVQRQSNSEYFIFDGFKHNGSWHKVWDGVLSLVAGTERLSLEAFKGEGSLARVFAPLR